MAAAKPALAAALQSPSSISTCVKSTEIGRPGTTAHGDDLDRPESVVLFEDSSKLVDRLFAENLSPR